MFTAAPMGGATGRSVSYTHLDVYKRQVLARLAQVFSEDANMRMGRIIDSVEPVLAGFLTVSVGITPVSYTHLDVYKRQGVILPSR